jgi:hypothetical protein
MNRVAKVLLLVGILVIARVAIADIPDKYQTIVDRNAFGLLPPPPPPDLSQTTSPPPANIKLTGFATLSGVTRAFFEIKGKEAKDTQFTSLPEGQRDGILEVLKISQDDGEVRIRNSGVDMVISMKTNGNKPGGPAPGGMPPPLAAPAPAPAGQPGGTVYNPAANPSVVYQGNYGKANPAAQPGGMPQPGQVGNPVNVNGNPGGQPPVQQTPEGIRTIPTRTLRLPPVNQNGNPQGSIAPENNGVTYSPTSRGSHGLTMGGGNNSGVVYNPGTSGGVVYNPNGSGSGNENPIDVGQQYINMLAQAEQGRRQSRPIPPPPPIPGQ